MRVLLDTNILIYREAVYISNPEIGVLFKWLDKLNCSKCIHPLSLQEIQTHKDPKIVKSFNIKLSSYETLKTEAPESPEILAIRKNDKTRNSEIDTSLLKEVYADRVDCMITEDRGIHRKAKSLGVENKVFTIDGFLEKATAENPALSEYTVLAVKSEYFGAIDVNDSFFDSFRKDYRNFDQWFNRKSDEQAYICKSDSGEMQAFLYLKVESKDEAYFDISPQFLPKKRLKIGTLKVTLNGNKLGERFLKIVFDNAVIQNVDEIYVTIFDETAEQQRLIGLLEDWGFRIFGKKTGGAEDELVLVRDFSPRANVAQPSMTFPYMSGSRRKFIVPIYPQYHTELLPDSILRTEDPKNYEGNRPNRNALRKVYISRSINRDMESGDIVVFYRTASGTGPAYYTSVATTLGIVEDVTKNISKLEDFVSLCRKRSVFTDAELARHWDYNPNNRPFVVNFLHTYSLPKRPNLKSLRDSHVIVDAPRGFEPLSNPSFEKLLEISDADQSLIVN